MHKVYLLVPLHTGVVCSSIVFFLCMYCLSPSCFTHIKKGHIWIQSQQIFTHFWWFVPALLTPATCLVHCTGTWQDATIVYCVQCVAWLWRNFWPMRPSQVWAHHLKSSCLLTVCFITTADTGKAHMLIDTVPLDFSVDSGSVISCLYNIIFYTVWSTCFV